MITRGDTLKRRKAMLRRAVRADLERLTAEHRAAAATRALALLRQQADWSKAKSVLLYAPAPDELDLWPVVPEAMAAGKQVALPRYVRQTGSYIACEIRDLAADVVVGQFGIREPTEGCAIVPLLRLDFILVPGVAFDLHGRRLGRGKGFYDQILAAVRGRTCGVGFDEQLVREVPVEPHDIYLNCILTPTRWIAL